MIMKRRELVRRIAKRARQVDAQWAFVREGANHTIYELGGMVIPIPRHTELDGPAPEMIFKECEPVLGKRWWK
jgi:hypothetical protein